MPVLWSYREAAWDYPRFLIVLASPLLLYSLAITLVPRDLTPGGSWRDHFYRVRVRAFVLLAAWMAVVSVVNWRVLDYPLLSRIRLGHPGFIALCGVGAASSQPKFQGLVVGLTIAVMVLLIVGLFFAPGALAEHLRRRTVWRSRACYWPWVQSVQPTFTLALEGTSAGKSVP